MFDATVILGKDLKLLIIHLRVLENRPCRKIDIGLAIILTMNDVQRARQPLQNSLKTAPARYSIYALGSSIPKDHMP
ncbi:hypothetical protein U1769_14355 [Sphingomonas sp. ZT3P38]|uniref:hypothetical protein n=1 Tax=Parasphingomonas zepuensis TaxID=3096161 RepID=UPI002FC5A528